LLSEDGVSLREFAKRSNVDPKQIRRDLAAFRELGQSLVHGQFHEGERKTRWAYRYPQRALFAVNGGKKGGRVSLFWHITKKASSGVRSTADVVRCARRNNRVSMIIAIATPLPASHCHAASAVRC
jgi:hypothetical protein